METRDNPLLKLQGLGQSVWLDFIRRRTVTSGELRRHIEADGVRGMTSNPSIFAKAISTGSEYEERIRALAVEGKSAAGIYEAVTVEDIQLAADVFRPLYDSLRGRDGFVSLEVSPLLAHDTIGTAAEARRLWRAVDRPNVMIKVPATEEGIPAIRVLVSEGINVNVTLLFGLERYEQVADAWLSGLELRAARLQPVSIASVASFFLSRIDVQVDTALLDARTDRTIDDALVGELRGQTAIASARIAYQKYKRIVRGERFRKLAAKGARPQRLLWASTSTKDPAYSDVKYVEALIGPETINTMPLETFIAYRDHGAPMLRLEEDEHDAPALLQKLRSAGVDLDEVTQRLEDDGVRKFAEAYAGLMGVIAERREEAVGGSPDASAHP